LKVDFLSGQRFCTVVFLNNLAPNAVLGSDGTRADSAPIVEELRLADEYWSFVHFYTPQHCLWRSPGRW
jgi:hypothetical protein